MNLFNYEILVLVKQLDTYNFSVSGKYECKVRRDTLQPNLARVNGNVRIQTTKSKLHCLIRAAHS